MRSKLLELVLAGMVGAVGPLVALYFVLDVIEDRTQSFDERLKSVSAVLGEAGTRLRAQEDKIAAIDEKVVLSGGRLTRSWSSLGHRSMGWRRTRRA